MIVQGYWSIKTTMSATSAKKPEPAPKETRRRTLSVADVRCDIGNCKYSAKTSKTVEKHRQKAHDIAPNKSAMDQSLSASLIFGSEILCDGSLDHKTSTEIYQDMSKVKQSTQLTVSDHDDAKEADNRRRRKRSDEEDLEEDKKIKLGASEEPQSQRSIDRQILISEALAAAKVNNQEDLNNSRSLLENQSETIFANSELFQDSSNETMLTAKEENSNNETDSLGLGLGVTVEKDDASQESSALDYTNGLDPQAEEVKNLEKELKLRTDSLKDSLAKNADLRSQVASAERRAEYLETKLTAKDGDISALTEALKILKDSLETKNQQNNKEPESKKVAALNLKVSSLEKELADQKAITDGKKVTNLNQKILTLEKKVEGLKDENARLKDSAEGSQTMATGLRQTQIELLSQISILKKKTLCLDDNCTSEKDCGASHSKKEENRGPCKYFFHGKCTKGNDCTFKHDAAAKSKYHKEIQERKEAKEKEEKDKKEKEEREKAEKTDAEKKTKEKREKLKLKRKRRREQKKAGAVENSSTMEVDPDSADDTETSKSEPVPKKAKTPKVIPPTKGTSKTKEVAVPASEASLQLPTHPPPAVQTPANVPCNFNVPPPPSSSSNTIPNPNFHIPPPNSNPNQFQFHQHIPNTFNFSHTPNPMPHSLLPPGGLAQGHGTLGGENPWPVLNQAQLGIEMARRQEAVHAQSMNRAARLNQLRAEISNVQSRIQCAPSQAPGSIDIGLLVNLEQNLQQRLYEMTFLNAN